ncbi:DNA polymerase kappa-like [Mya arenaria]|uniref:DNA polymerase kappa-like n=1 Tax=Mya arenaria TaxID=6604 RepID=UPI0022E9102C|nr:DNA polymerase kappa-like [Mya arenaria]
MMSEKVAGWDDDDEEDWMDTGWAQPQQSGIIGQRSPTGYPTQNQAMVDGSIYMDGNTETKTLSSSDSAHSGVKESFKSDLPEGLVGRMLLNDNKAGMEGLDKAKINQIIHEASKGSKFFENEREKEAQMKVRISQQHEKVALITAEQLVQGKTEADKLLEDFEQQRDLSRTIVHVDMDMFYAAVEMLDNPALRNKPMAVGGNSMLSTSNYNARKFGVRAAMPGFIGKKLCPDLVIVPLNFEKYTAVSKQVKAIISMYDPNYCPMSLDEAYLDITDHLEKRKFMTKKERTVICRDSAYTDSRNHCLCDLNEIHPKHGKEKATIDSEYSHKNTHEKTDADTMGPVSIVLGNESSNSSQVNLLTDIASPSKERESVKAVCPECGKLFPPFEEQTFGTNDEDAVQEMRCRIEQRTRLTASAGIAPNMMLAKVCSDRNKPNGQFKIAAERENVMDFIQDLPTRKISGIGKVSEAMLNALGVCKCRDLYERRGLLYHLYSPISFNYFMRICLGIGSTTVERDGERKSISTERTFSELSRPEDLYLKCEELCCCLADDLKEEQLKGKTVSIKIKTVKFEVKTRAHTLPDYTNDAADVIKAATALLKTEIQNAAPQPLRLRLMGVRMSNLLHESQCKGVKQNTIVGAFKKLANKSQNDKDKSTKHLNAHNEAQCDDFDNVKTSLKNRNTTSNSTAQTPETGLNPSNKQKEMPQIIEDNKTLPKDVSKSETDICDSEMLPVQETQVFNSNDVRITSTVLKSLTSDDDKVVVMVGNQRQTRSGTAGTPWAERRRNRRNTATEQRLACPICGRTVVCTGLAQFNEHVDECLEGQSTQPLNLDTQVSPAEKTSDTENEGQLEGKNKRNKTENSENVKGKEDSTEHVKQADASRRAGSDQEKHENNVPVLFGGRGVEADCHLTNGEFMESRGPNCNNENSFRMETEYIEKDRIQDNDVKLIVDFNDHNIDTDCEGVVLIREEPKLTKETEHLDIQEPCNALKSSEMNNIRSAFIHTNMTSKFCGNDKCKSNASSNHVTNVDHESGKEIDVLLNGQVSQTSDALLAVVKKFCDKSDVELSTSAKNCKQRYSSDPSLPCLKLYGLQDLNCEVSKGAEDKTICDDEDFTLQTFNSNQINEDRVVKIDIRETAACTKLMKGSQASTSLYEVTCQQETEKVSCPFDKLTEASSDISSYEPEPSTSTSLHYSDIDLAYSEKEPMNSNQSALSLAPDSPPAGRPSASLLVCPVCNTEQRLPSLEAFNSHVDQCLSRGTISEILRQQNREGISVKRPQITSPSAASQRSHKKRKTVIPSSTVPCQSIKSFFQK